MIFYSLGPVLLSRFIINLRQVSEPTNETEMAHFSQFSAHGFHIPTSINRVLGNMGETLELGDDEEDEVVEQNGGSAMDSRDHNVDNTDADAASQVITDPWAIQEVTLSFADHRNSVLTLFTHTDTRLDGILVPQSRRPEASDLNQYASSRLSLYLLVFIYSDLELHLDFISSLCQLYENVIKYKIFRPRR